MSRHFWRACGCEPQSGLTLVELLVTIVIAGIAFAAIVPVFVQALTTSSQEKVRLAALNVAQDKIEKIRQLDFDQIAATNLASETTTTAWKYASEFGPHWKSDTGRVYNVYYSVDESLNTKQVYVTVDWTAPPLRVPNTFVPSPDYGSDPDDPTYDGYGVTLSTIIYKQYGGAQVIDIKTVPDSSKGLVTWDWALEGQQLDMTLEAVINPVDDNLTTADYAVFRGYGANDVLVLDQTVKRNTSDKFQVTWTPVTDRALAGSIDGKYRFEVTVYSSKGLPGNTYAEEFRLEMGPPLPPVDVIATGGDKLATLNWTASQTADAASYQVWRRDVTAGGVPEPVGGNQTSTVYVDTPLMNGDHYEYYIVAVDWLGHAGSASEPVSAYPHLPPDTTAPPSPYPVTSIPTPGWAVLTWPDVVDTVVDTQQTSGIDHYVVVRDDGQRTSKPSPKAPGATVTFTQRIAANHTYSVVALDAVGNQSGPSATVAVIYVPLPAHELTVSANKIATFTVRDIENVVVYTSANTLSITWTLPEGEYAVTANKGNVTNGPQSVVLTDNQTLEPFVF